MVHARAEFARYLRTETIGGIIMLGATVLALVVANSPLDQWYFDVRDTTLGPSGLRLSVGHWAADGLLAVFFFVAGLELKRELVVGELRQWRQAALPVFAALGGMLVPALVALAIAAGAPGGSDAWPVPVATDIAFALAVLAVTASALPASVRLFLLSLAVVDDLGAILLIALLFTSNISWPALGGAIALLALYALAQKLRIRSWLIYAPIALGTWYFVYESGVHATIAGVALGLLTRVKSDPGETFPPAERMEHLFQPISAGLCVPLFAFFAAGLALSSKMLDGFASDRVVWAVLIGLVVGKFLGVLSGSFLAIKLRVAALSSDLHWRDLIALSILAGCGFTVSLLIAELAFDSADQRDRVKLAVLMGSAIASLAAAFALRLRLRARNN
ncbi:MAG: Na+/H+ antiporter NhaA [Corynebacteriales bacterium]|nr:Na+/H+ antiporter NhaA [Mycobacteriales bacterium]